VLIGLRRLGIAIVVAILLAASNGSARAATVSLNAVFSDLTDRHVVAVNPLSPSCTMVSTTPVVLSAAGKGKIDASLDVAPPCDGLPVSYTQRLTVSETIGRKAYPVLRAKIQVAPG
jgi:hypothetical protein